MAEDSRALPATIAGVWLGSNLALSAQRAVIPRLLARSALFSSLPPNAKRKVYITDTLLACWGGDSPQQAKTMLYQCQGVQLTQTEESIWLELLRIALQSPVSVGQDTVRITFTANGLLRALGRETDTKNRKDIMDAVRRIGRARLRISAPTPGRMHDYEGNLLSLATLKRTGDTGFCCSLDLALATLFGSGWSYINLLQRQALRSNPLAQWLHTHYSTHAVPFPIHHDKLKVLSGRADMRGKLWLAGLLPALADLHRATGWRCTLDTKNNVIIRKGVGLVEPAAAQLSSAPKALSRDDVLLSAWLRSLTKTQLLTHLTRIGVEFAVPLHTLGIVDLLPVLEQVLLAPPQRPRLLRRLVSLRAADAAASLCAQKTLDAQVLATAAASTEPLIIGLDCLSTLRTALSVLPVDDEEEDI